MPQTTLKLRLKAAALSPSPNSHVLPIVDKSVSLPQFP